MLYQSQHETRQFEWNTRIATRANVLFGILIRSHSVCVCVFVWAWGSSWLLFYTFSFRFPIIVLCSHCSFGRPEQFKSCGVAVNERATNWPETCARSPIFSPERQFSLGATTAGARHTSSRSDRSCPAHWRLNYASKIIYLYCQWASVVRIFFIFFVPRLFIVSFFVRRQWVIRVAQFRCLFSSLHNAHGLELHHTAMLFLGSWDAWTLLILINLCGCHFISKPFGDGSQQSVRR